MTFLVQPTPRSIRSEQALFPLTSSVQQPPTSTWCKQAACHCVVLQTLSSQYQDIASHQPLTCLKSVCLPCVWPTGENMNESSTSLPPSSAPTCFFLTCHWQCEWKGTGFSLGDSLKLQVQIPTEVLSEQEYSQSAFVTIIQGSFNFTWSNVHTWNMCWFNSHPLKHM